MNQSMWGIFFVVIGILGIFFINLFEDITSTNDQNYYLLKETTQAAMFDSIDLAQFREYGTLRIIKEKFVENFTRRFAESTNIQKSYKIEFLEIIEEPPKVTVRVGSSSAVTFTEEDFDIDISNVLDAILETNWIGAETNQPTLAGCRIKVIPAYTYSCKKVVEVCEPIFECSGQWRTIKETGYMYILRCTPYGDWVGESAYNKPCGPCVKNRGDVLNYNETCRRFFYPGSSYIGSCTISSKRICDGTQIKVGEDCKNQTIYTTCLKPAQYEVVCD